MVASASISASFAGGAASSAAGSARAAANKVYEYAPDYEKLAAWMPADASRWGRGFVGAQESDADEPEDTRNRICGVVPCPPTRSEVLWAVICPLLGLWNLMVIIYVFQYIWLRRYD